MTAPQTGRIFISYRRADSAGYAGRIYDRLSSHFGKDAIFMDVDTIQAGLDFVDVLENAVQSCDVVVVLLGTQWINIKDETGKRRLDNPQDFVRIEVATALSRGIRVIPVLVDGTPMPNTDQLPSNLKPLTRRNAVPVNHYSFHSDANRLIEQLELALKDAERSKILKAKELKEKEEQKKQQEEIEKLLLKTDFALDLKDWGLAKEQLLAILTLEPNHIQAQIKLDIVERKQRETKEKAESERLATQKAEQERVAKAKFEADQKTQAEKKAKDEAERLAIQKAEKERAAQARRDSDRIAEEKRQTDKAREEASRPATLEAKQEGFKNEKVKAGETVKLSADVPKAKKGTSSSISSAGGLPKIQFTQPLVKWGVIGIVGLCFLGGSAWGISSLLKPLTPPPTEASFVTESPSAGEPVNTKEPSQPGTSEKVQIHWFVGLGYGTSDEQIAAQNEVVTKFNASQDHIELILDVVPLDNASDTLTAQIASGNAPDIVGPAGLARTHDFHGQWLDLAPYIESSGFDTSIYNPALLDYYKTDEGQVGLPFSVFTGAMYFVPSMFDEAGLNYPPQIYGEKYILPDGTKVDWDWETITEIARLLTIDENGRNATEFGFDSSQIVQFGYSPQWQSILSIGSFYSGANKIYTGDAKGSYQSNIPNSWKEAWKWYYDGMWGDQPFIPTGPFTSSSDLTYGNVFLSGKAAMDLSQSWYTCCLDVFRDSGNEFQLGIQPIGANGEVAGRIDADTFHILKTTEHPNEAFEVLTYLITTGGDILHPVYQTMPAITWKTDAYLAKKSEEYPFVTDNSWSVFVQGLAYPDIPSTDQYRPNSTEVYGRFGTFMELLNYSENLNFDTEFRKLEDDLTVIYNK